jgi:hypothetical protein
VKSNGNNENTPATVVTIKVRKYASLSAASKLITDDYRLIMFLVNEGTVPEGNEH